MVRSWMPTIPPVRPMHGRVFSMQDMLSQRGLGGELGMAYQRESGLTNGYLHRHRANPSHCRVFCPMMRAFLP